MINGYSEIYLIGRGWGAEQIALLITEELERSEASGTPVNKIDLFEEIKSASFYYRITDEADFVNTPFFTPENKDDFDKGVKDGIGSFLQATNF